MNKTFKIGDRTVGEGQRCFVIAEAGVNHNGEINLAKRLVDEARLSGADAVKFQTFKAEDLVIESVPMAEYQQKNTGKRISQVEMLKCLELEYNCFAELKKCCDEKGILFLSTPHTEEALDFLDDLIPAYKIGSGDLNNIPFLQRISKKGKPIILGTGMATLQEVIEAVRTISNQGNEQVIVLHCTSEYPCPIEDVNLRAMVTLREELKCLVGYSDHTLGINVPIMASALGAVVIEKHITLDKSLHGPDHKTSLDPEEFKKMVSMVRDTEISLGSNVKKPTPKEEKLQIIVRKSMVAKVDIPEGSQISEDMLIAKRPGEGISPREINSVIGSTAKRYIRKNEVIHWELLDF